MTTSAADHLIAYLFRPSTTRQSLIAALFVFGLLSNGVLTVGAEQSPGSIVTYRGATMGTSYMVKVFDPPPQLGDELQVDIDLELRKVNDQMSTYLKSSEISRFNASSSTTWFDVSAETAMVVDYALSVSKKTEGAFDVTIAPLVNLWSFGPEERPNVIPSDEEIKTRRASVGFSQLDVRLDPPALKKAIATLQVDLSAIAKGHGVDRVVELLQRRGAENVFVEIGGEVRVIGDKAGEPWMVGIERPDSQQTTLLVRHPIRQQSMATSGDYRNQFKVGGKSYSHTIDPRTGRPVTHDLASVTVLGRNCMQADAWATAINVVGASRGLELAKQEGLDVLLVQRGENAFELQGTGALSQYVSGAATPEAPAGMFYVVTALTLIAFGIVLGGMAIGVIFGRRPISGSCGGIAGTKEPDGSTRCSLCSNPSDACKELRDRMAQEESS